MSTLIAISGLGIICLLLEILNLRKILVPVTVILLSVILGLTVAEFYMEPFVTSDDYNMIISTGYSRAFSILFILLAIFIIIMSPQSYQDKTKISDYVALKVFMLAGAVAMVSFGNFAMFFIGIEILSIAGYILASGDPRNIKSNEAGMKYFIMGAFASSFILFGIALIYGATGSFNIEGISTASILLEGELPVWFYIGFVMISIGMFFKASIAPFHFWSPDVYEGSPTIVTTLMSTLVKVAALGALFKIVTILYSGITPAYQMMIIVLSILTMFAGNITALRQTNIKRMMAYSGISHAGFMMMTLLATDTAANTILYYASAYSLSGIAAFAVILYVCQGKDNEDISNFYGLAKKQPLPAIILASSMFSLGGIPVFSGFFAKFFVFDQMLATNHIWLVLLGVINSIIAIYYYFKVVNVMFTKSSLTKDRPEMPLSYMLVGIIAAVLNLVIGVFPSLIMGLMLD